MVVKRRTSLVVPMGRHIVGEMQKSISSRKSKGLAEFGDQLTRTGLFKQASSLTWSG